MPTLHWHAQTVAHYDYLLEDPREAAVLAGSHCIPVRVPAVERFVWHKLYSGVVRKSFPEKAAKDLRQAATLAAALAEQDEDALADSATALPKAMRKAVASHWKLVLGSIGDYGLARQTLERALGDLHPVP